MSKILYIGPRVDRPQNGGDIINLRNIKALSEVYRTGFYHYELKYRSRLLTLVNLLNNNVGGISKNDYKDIIDFIEFNSIEKIFLYSSKLGNLAKFIRDKYPKMTIVVFFHNVEQHYYKEELKIKASWKNKLIAKVVELNEKLSVDYADILITLNARDSNMLYDIYGRMATFELPTSFEDKYNVEKARQYIFKKNGKLQLLFVGYNFFANTQGIGWFIDNVLSELPDVHLTIVGKDMDRAFRNSKQVSVFGYVDDLSLFYYQSDVVILPIFYGGGMKTKTAEAMMYGCPIVGTSEAFVGYDLNYDKIGSLCKDNREDFIKILTDMSKSEAFLRECRHYSRMLFVNRYNFSVSVETLKRRLKNE